jgi:DnaJ-class molecular chaperone
MEQQEVDGYYKILGLNANATQEDVKRAYKRLALQWHPDKPGGDAEKFVSVNEAYEALKNKVKPSLKPRQEYEVFKEVFGAPFEELVEKVWRKQKLHAKDQTNYWWLIGAVSGAAFGAVISGGVLVPVLAAVGGGAGTIDLNCHLFGLLFVGTV